MAISGVTVTVFTKIIQNNLVFEKVHLGRYIAAMRRLEGPRALETCSKSVSALENVANSDSKKQRRIERTLSEHSRKVETMCPNC